MRVGYSVTLILSSTALAWRWPWDKPTAPTHDRFYTQPPKNLQAMANGEIIDCRRIRDIQKLDYDSAWQVRYRSSRTNGEPTFGLTTIIVPRAAPHKADFISYMQVQDATCLDCAPSYQMRTDAADVKLQPMLDQGLVLNIPDHQGPHSAFGAGRLEGALALDSIRAALASAKWFDSKVANDSKTAIYGFSGGSIPAGWAYQMQKTHAPELSKNIAGAVASGVVANPRALLDRINKHLQAGFIPPAILGLSTEYPEIAGLLANELTWGGKMQFKQQQGQCMLQNLLQYMFSDIFLYFKSGREVLDRPHIRRVLDSLNMGRAAADWPLYVVQGLDDEVAPVAAVDTAIDQFCKHDARVFYQRVPGGDHTGTETSNWPYSLQWMVDALRGRIHYTNCTQEDASIGYIPKSASSPSMAISGHENMGLKSPDEKALSAAQSIHEVAQNKTRLRKSMHK